MADPKPVRLPRLLLGLALAVSACGGGPEPVAPVAGPASGPAQPGPTESGPSAPELMGGIIERPQMNARAEQAYRAGLQAFQAGDLAGARAQFQQATQADPRAFQAYYSLGVVYERYKETSNALGAYQKALSIVPEYEPAIYSYAVLLARTGRGADAETFLTSKMAKLPKSAAVTAALAEVKSLDGDSAEAQRLAQEALKKDTDYRPAMLTLARDHYRARRLDLALYTLKGILDGYGPENPARDKNNAEARMLRAVIFKEQGLKKPAIEDFEKALELRPDLVEARVQLASYMLESGNAQEAAQLLEGALRYDTDNVLARLNLGDAYRLLGKTSEAKRELEWVLHKDPNLAQAHYNLGLLYLFSTTVPGVSPKEAANRAISELEIYTKMKPRGSGVPDDTEELITRAKTKKALIEAKEAEQTAAPAPAEPPAASGSGSLPPVNDGKAPPLKGGSQ